MVSVVSQLIKKVTAHAESDSLEDAREICADGTYFPNNLRISTIRSMFAVLNMVDFRTAFISCFPDMVFRYFLKDFEMVLLFTFHKCCISIVVSLYFRIFLASFLIMFQPPDNTISINGQVLFSLSRIMKSGLLLEMFLTVDTCCFQNTLTLSSKLVSDSCSYKCPLHTLPLFPCIY